jgi:Tfp pilus assembly protein PilF
VNRIEKLREMLRTSPNDSFLNHALALEYIKLGDDQQAGILFEALLANEPGYVGSYYHIAKLKERNGETEAAIFWYEKGMEITLLAGDKHAYGELRSAYEELTF